MQVREQLLLGAEPVIFRGNGLLDFDDQVRSSEHLVRGADNASAGRDVLVVGKSAARPSTCLHHDLPAVIGQLGNAIGLHRHPTFLVLDFLRHTNHQSGHTVLPRSGAHAARSASTTLRGATQPLPPPSPQLE